MSEQPSEKESELISENEKLNRRIRELEDELEEQHPEPQNERDERGEESLRKRREWLRSLTQKDRNFIAKYGEELWRNWKNRSWKGEP